MTTENSAAQAEDTFTIEGDDHTPSIEVNESQNSESATATEVNQGEVEAAVKPAEDGFQKRINKVTADKYVQQRRADDLQAKLDAINSKSTDKPVKAPTLEDYEHDEDAFNKANISYQVQQELAKQHDETQNKQTEVKARQDSADFNKRIAEFGKEDFADKANAIPVLPPGVADALMQSENGAELIYHLGEHLDKADALASMTTGQALMELGRLSGEMSKQPTIKQSAAPDPIEPLSSGGAVKAERGPKGATFE